MSELFVLKKYFVRYKWLLMGGVVFILLSNYFRVLAPQLTGYIINTVVVHLKNSQIRSAHPENLNFLVYNLIVFFEKQSFAKQIFFSGILLLLLAVISGLFMFFMRQTLIVMSRHIEYDQKNEIYEHYQRLDLSFLKKNSTGDLMNRISEDVSRVRMFTGPAVMYFINLAAVIGFSVYFMFSTDVKLSWVALSPLPILSLTIYLVNNKIHLKSEKIQQILSRLTSISQESYSGIRIIKSYVQEKSVSNFFSEQTESYRMHSMSLTKTESIYFPSMSFLIGLSTLLTVLVGGLEVVHGAPGASVGKIAAFVLYIQMLTFPVSAIGLTISMMQRAAASQKRINEFMKVVPEIQEPQQAVEASPTGNIELQHLCFCYKNTGIQAVDDISCRFRKGEKILILGKTGSGKTTLAMLLLRFLEADSGKILYDGIPVTDLSLNRLRRVVGYVAQDVFLFSDTIRNNIALSNPNTDLPSIEKAARLAGIHEEICNFQDGFETLIGERGVTLSGGQKQRISIARALVKDPDILILDDCLSAVDTQTERHINDLLDSHFVDKTVIIIAHRIPSNITFNQILVLEAGKISEQGDHEVLISQHGKYYDLFQKQLVRQV